MASSESSKKKATMQTVDRALEAINLIANSPDGLSVIELSNALSITRTSAYNIVNSLLAENYVEKDEKNNRYCIGYRFLEYAAVYRYRYPFVSIAERFLDHFDQRFQVNLYMFKPPMKILLLHQRKSPSIARVSTSCVIPANASASGKLLLAFMPEAKRDEYLSTIVYKRYAKNTIMTEEALRKSIAQAKAQKYAVEIEELLPGRACVAAPIMDYTGAAIAAISLGGDVNTILDNLDDIISQIKSIAQAISFELGYRYGFSQ